jgi:HEAT repeat protein
MKTVLALSLVLCLVPGSDAAARAQQGRLAPATKIAELAKRPLSPGVVALLFVHAHEPEATKMLEAALTDAKPEIRAAAARTLAGFNAAPFMPALRRALAEETDLDAGREQLRALASLVGPAEDAALAAAARRIGEPLVGALAVTLARVRGAAALDLYFSTLRQTRIPDWDLHRFLRLATRARRGAAADAFAKACQAVSVKGDD